MVLYYLYRSFIMISIYRVLNISEKKKYSMLLLAFAFFIFLGCTNKNRTWTVYKADAASSSYSPLRQVNRDNVHLLRLAWTFSPNDAAKDSHFGASQSNPIIIDGIMYTASARHRIYAINADNGKQIWSFDPFNGGAGGGSFRGVTWWQDGEDKRILFTGGDNLFALRAETGIPIKDFGKGGKVSMNVGIRDDPG